MRRGDVMRRLWAAAAAIVLGSALGMPALAQEAWEAASAEPTTDWRAGACRLVEPSRSTSTGAAARRARVDWKMATSVSRTWRGDVEHRLLDGVRVCLWGDMTIAGPTAPGSVPSAGRTRPPSMISGMAPSPSSRCWRAQGRTRAGRTSAICSSTAPQCAWTVSSTRVNRCRGTIRGVAVTSE